ncbi:hypothetical protein [Streptomyces sp. 3211]|uniref:hypothetical protein n=1 Tax=Streptomyces sp. 3211 TaxID=1964449 RepID=UPI0009A4DD1A|nr:hypothetical protein [Streptomyces sp. 3211]
MEERSEFRRTYGDARGLRVRIRDLGPMRNAAYLPTEAPSGQPTMSGLERIVPRRRRSTSGPRTAHRSGGPGTYTHHRTFAVNDRDGESIFDITIDIVIRKR